MADGPGPREPDPPPGRAGKAWDSFSAAGDYLALASFCLLATSGFVALELYSVRAPAAASIRLAALRTWLDTHGNKVIIIVRGVDGHAGHPTAR